MFRPFYDGFILSRVLWIGIFCRLPTLRGQSYDSTTTLGRSRNGHDRGETRHGSQAHTHRHPRCIRFQAAGNRRLIRRKARRPRHRRLRGADQRSRCGCCLHLAAQRPARRVVDQGDGGRQGCSLRKTNRPQRHRGRDHVRRRRANRPTARRKFSATSARRTTARSSANFAKPARCCSAD